MKKLVSILTVVTLFMLGYIYKDFILTSTESLLYQSKCDNPKTYHVGSIDPKYNLSKEQVLVSIKEAGSVWSEAESKELFAYDPKGDIEVNLVYDQRSLLNSQINDLNSKVKEQQNALDPKIADYKNKAAAFRAKINQLNSDIEFWNSKGGAPEDEYNKLKDRQAELKDEAESLRAEAQSLNQSTEEFNAQVGQLHQTVDSFNQELAFKPEEGEYIFDNGRETINIYFDNTRSELIHTLAHELGHSIGIQHNNSEQSIMYPRTTDAITLSDLDKKSLEEVCKKQNIFILFTNKLAVAIMKAKSQNNKN